nr:uncharacterized protein LOC112727534 [Arachis hypogaea]
MVKVANVVLTASQSHRHPWWSRGERESAGKGRLFAFCRRCWKDGRPRRSTRRRLCLPLRQSSTPPPELLSSWFEFRYLRVEIKVVVKPPELLVAAVTRGNCRSGRLFGSEGHCGFVSRDAGCNPRR